MNSNKIDLNRSVALCVFMLMLMTSAIWYGCESNMPRRAACDNCISNRPDSGAFIVKCTPPSTGRGVPIQIYKGDYIDGILTIRDTLYEPEKEYFLEVNTVYTAAAEYKNGLQTILALNTGKVRRGKEGCIDSSTNDDEVTYYCWFIIPAKTDVRLKEKP